MRFTARLVGTALTTAAFAPAVALAQTTTSGPIITQSQAFFPDRIVNGVDVGTSTRPMNLNPFGINYDDCAKDMQLRFTVTVSNWTAGDTLQVWVTNTTDCTGTATRGVGVQAASCWEVASDPTLVGSTGSSFTRSYTVNVRDIVGPQNRPPWPPGPGATNAVGEGDGINACKQQQSFLAVPMYVWFMAVNSAGNVDGTPFQYGAPNTTATGTTTGTTGTFTADLVGPPAPTSTPVTVGDTLIFVNWTPNVDSDTTGYDIMIDPIPGTEGSVVDSGPIVDATTLVCPGATMSDAAATGDAIDESAAGDDGGGDEAGASSSSSGGSSSSSGAATPTGCVNSGSLPPANPNNTCNDPTLTAATIIGSAGTVTSTEEASTTTDEAGDIVEDEASTTSATEGSFGLSLVPTQYIIGYNGSGQLTVPDIQTGTFTVSGLQNGVRYTVAVAAVDTSGNIGPPSAEQCDSPAPVDDFWKIYSNDGGRAGGGFCALEAIGRPAPLGFCVGALGITGVIALRRRRRRAN